MLKEVSTELKTLKKNSSCLFIPANLAEWLDWV